MNKRELIRELIREKYLKTPLFAEAFQKIDRRDFVPEDLRDEAYGNYPLPIGFGQTISQPLTVAFMLELLEPKTGEKILDIGAGSGWTTALLSYVASSAEKKGKVIGIERIEELAKTAEENVGKYNFIKRETAKIIYGDGSRGYENEAPYDKIISAASTAAIPQSWKDQLKSGGRLVAPVGQNIVVLDKIRKSEFREKNYFGFSFVPLLRD